MNVVSDLDGSGRPDDEVVRLRDELAGLQQRLDEERSFYRARLEAQRQEFERDQVRDQAGEVARRRRAEERLSTLQDELAAARAETERARRSYSELETRLLEVERSNEAHTRSEVERVLAAAKSSWRFAEEELSRSEEELSRARSLLARERERNLRLTELVKDLRSKQLVMRDKTTSVPPLERPQVTASVEQWTNNKIAEIDDQLSDEFLLLEADHSFETRPKTASERTPAETSEPEEASERAALPGPLPSPTSLRFEKARFDIPSVASPQVARGGATPPEARARRFGWRRRLTVSAVILVVAGTVALYQYAPLRSGMSGRLLEVGWPAWLSPDAADAGNPGELPELSEPSVPDIRVP